MKIKVLLVLLFLIGLVPSNPIKTERLRRTTFPVIVGNAYVQGYLNADGTFVIRTSAGQIIIPVSA